MRCGRDDMGRWGRLIYRLATGALMIGWMVIIFCFSAQPAPESAEVSMTVSYRVVSAVDRAFSLDMDEGERIAWAERIDYPVRKAAHMTEYAILCILAFACVSGYAGGTLAGVAPFAIASIYAVTDEIHQSYVPGRACLFSDVFVDMAGASIGLLVVWAALRVARAIRGRARQEA